MSAVPIGADAAAPVDAAEAALDREIVTAKVLSPADRLEASRARLRSALDAIAHPPKRESKSFGLGKLTGLFGAGPSIAARLKSVPLAAFLVDTVESWWAEHPLRTVAMVAKEASREFVLPVARRNPYGLLFGALAAGALLILSRPWRWLLRPALFLGIAPQLAKRALKKMPVQSWVRMFNALTAARPTRSTAKSVPAAERTRDAFDPSAAASSRSRARDPAAAVASMP